MGDTARAGRAGPEGENAAAPLPIDRVHGGNLPREVLDLSTSINPLGPPPAALEAYHAAAESIAGYPPPYPRRLEAHLARWLGVGASNVLAGNGTTHLIYLLARVLAPRRPLVVTPTFSEIANALTAAGAAPRAAPARFENGFRIDRHALGRALADGADALFLGRPNSPTGTITGFEAAAEIARQCARAGACCVFDEAFIDFVPDARSVAELACGTPGLIVLRSLTKIFAIPGLRLGCLIAHRETAAKLRGAIEPWAVNSAAEPVALACLDGAGEFIRRTRELIARERVHAGAALARIPGLRVIPSVANFLMFRVENEREPGSFGRHMMKAAIAVRDLATLPGCGAGFYRVGLRLRAENERLIAAARAWRP